MLPALTRRLHEAKLRGDGEVVIWGTGTPRREFLQFDDLTSAVVHLMRTYVGEKLVNIGCGADVTIRELAGLVARVAGFTGGLVYAMAKPDGTPCKLLEVTRLLALGWRPRIALDDGIADTYRWFAANEALARRWLIGQVFVLVLVPRKRDRGPHLTTWP